MKQVPAKVAFAAVSEYHQKAERYETAINRALAMLRSGAEWWENPPLWASMNEDAVNAADFAVACLERALEEE